MGCRIIAGTGDGTNEAAVFYCSTTMTAFGPVMNSLEEAEKFLEVSFAGTDPRNFNQRELSDKYADFVTKWVCECGTIRDDSCEGCKEGYETAIHNGKVIHRWSVQWNSGREDDNVAYCVADPEPKPGERFVCSRCCKKHKVSA